MWRRVLKSKKFSPNFLLNIPLLRPEEIEFILNKAIAIIDID
jgi:hypothetical protein